MTRQFLVFFVFYVVKNRKHQNLVSRRAAEYAEETCKSRFKTQSSMHFFGDVGVFVVNMNNPKGDKKIIEAVQKYGYTQQQIVAPVHVHYS